ncbi:MAG: hypothetical protein ABIQ70_14515 [Dokdonella sp.]
MNIPKTHTVCVVGAPADVATRIYILLDDQRTHLEARWRQGDHASADLLVIDADSVYGHMDWLKATSSGRMIAAYTKSPESYESYFSLRQPVTPADLVSLLNRVGARLGGAPAAPVASSSTAKTVDKAAPAPFRTSDEAVAKVAAIRAAAAAPAAPVVTPRVEVAPPKVAAASDTSPVAAAKIETASVVAPHAPSAPQTSSAAQRGIQLLDLLEPDPVLKGRLRLSAEGLPTLLLDPRERTWHSASGLKALSDWSTRSLTANDVHYADDVEFAQEIVSMPGHPYSRLQWLAHLILGEGQLGPGLDVKARYKLSRWPQSEREFPRHFRIATMMLKQAGTLDEIADQGGATAEDVANFINAYHALGYIEVEGAERAPESANRGGLFGRMRKTSTN